MYGERRILLELLHAPFSDFRAPIIVITTTVEPGRVNAIDAGCQRWQQQATLPWPA